MSLEFKKIEVNSIQEMLPFYAMRHNMTCDSVFLESYVWKDYYNVRYAIWENKALLWLMENEGRCFSAMPLCREEDLPGAFAAIEEYFNEELGYPLVINLADEYAVKYLNLPEDKYLVEEQVDSRDYLYNGDAMRSLAGKKLHKKKNRVNAFKREYEGRYEYRRLCCSDSHDVWVFLDRWRQQKGEEVEEHLDYEVKGIHDILKNCSEFSIHMGGVYIDGQMEAFTIGSYNPVEHMTVIHIEKANPEINGLYQFINQQFLIEEFPEAEWVNREDDMGLEGLRKAKMTYYPADYARKYLVEQLLNGSKGYHWAEQIANTTAGSVLTYLDAEDKDETKRLWHMCFPEDSESFIEYYYKEKTKDNEILVKKDNGLLISMVQYNPYSVKLRGRLWKLDYLVGVATEESRRREGHFRDVFVKMLHDEEAAGKPITYLVPVNPAVYAPMGFTFIGNVAFYELTEEAKQTLTRTVCQDTPEDCGRAAVYMEQWLGARYEMYTRRDAAYVSRLIKELASENGTLEFLEQDGRLVGLDAYWGWEVREHRLLYAEDAYTVKMGEKPWNMARLTNIGALLAAFGLKQAEQQGEEKRMLTLGIRMNDPILEMNNGEFVWTIGETGSSLKARKPEPDTCGCTENVSIWLETKPEELVSWLFGCRKAEEIWGGQLENKGLAEILAQVDTVNGVYLDEIV
ncbi:GNAT family N-acetyltransferase [Clostridium sp. AF20-7]|uniref:GNAT family N-acetyltransferase n=1 Tax=Clostridium sp. AF20-7 TaxID=2293002 RepID=UPI000E4C5241|nr:GNAT family N-acetyltransferase [Clostridium sp. AF20-7]